jgi:hypothetical protein
VGRVRHGASSSTTAPTAVRRAPRRARRAEGRCPGMKLGPRWDRRSPNASTFMVVHRTAHPPASDNTSEAGGAVLMCCDGA